MYVVLEDGDYSSALLIADSVLLVRERAAGNFVVPHLVEDYSGADLW